MVTDREPWSEQLKPWLRAVVARSIPLLAICYGHQLLAETFGGCVDWHPAGREIGTVDIQLTPAGIEDPLLGSLSQSFKAQVTHAQSVRSLPPEAVLLALNDFEPHHGFRIGRCAWGLQFHPEFNTDIMAQYIRHHELYSGLDKKAVSLLFNQLEHSHSAVELIRRFIEFD